MKSILTVGLTVATVALIAIAWFQSGGVERRRMEAAQTPDQAVKLMLTEVQTHQWAAAHDHLANPADIDQTAFIHDLGGTNGSLRTYATLENFQVWGLHTGSDEATVRAKLHYSTAVGPLDDVRDIKVTKTGNTWKVVWPTNTGPKLAPQVIPVNYLRWDIINRASADDWGVQNVDSPQVRIISMNALQRPDRVVIMGEIVNEDTVPAYVNVSAFLLGKDDNPVAQETSFDKISHTLLPKQVSPYRIDFPGARLDQVKSVRMEPKALLVPASADPVIEVNKQRIETDALGKKVLRGELINESGQVVNIPHVIASYYDANGKVIWVSDGYVDQELLPQIPVAFAVDVPDDIASNVHSYHVVVNYYLNSNDNT
jgi:hypothetical protein